MVESLINIYQQVRGFGMYIITATFIVFIISFVANLIIRKYIEILTIYSTGAAGKRENSTDILNKIVEDYKNTAAGSYSEVNTQAIIEKNFNLRLRGIALWERFIKNSNALLITLGLFGTFVGLTVAVGEIAGIFINMDIADIVENQGIQDLLRNLVSSLRGMSVAFVTNLVELAVHNPYALLPL